MAALYHLIIFDENENDKHQTYKPKQILHGQNFCKIEFNFGQKLYAQ